MTLKLADDLRLPLDVVTQTMAILAKRRAGKSYTMRRMVEQLVTASQQVVLVDPKGDQWGIRSSADGKGAGLPLVILGGERADVPLEPSAGEMVAKLVVEERVSAVIDLSLFRKHEVATFMTGFLENLYRMKAREQFRTPMMLVIDEADAVAPQKPQKGEERMLGAAEDIVRRGGQRGIGCVLVSQRSAVLNKNVLTQAQILVVLRTIAPQDLAAMKAWIDVHGSEEEGAELMDSLPSLPVGDAWFWSPGWPTTKGIFKRVHVLPIETFDSGATPKPGEKRREPKTVADIDLDALKRQMSAAIEKAKADDPRELRKQLAEANRMLANQAKAIGELQARTPAGKEKRVEVPVLKDAQIARVEKLVDRYAKLLDAVIKQHGSLAEPMQQLVSAVHAVRRQAQQPAPDPRPVVQPRASYAPERTAPPPPRQPSSNGHGDASVGNSGLRRMLVALAQRNGLTRRQLGVRAGLSSRSGTFDTYLSKGRTHGWIGGTKDRIEITDAGVAALGSYEPLPEGQALLDHWLGELGESGAARILRALATTYPRALSRQELGEAANLSDRSGTFDTYLSRLRTLELIQGKSEIKASDELFEP